MVAVDCKFEMTSGLASALTGFMTISRLQRKAPDSAELAKVLGRYLYFQKSGRRLNGKRESGLLITVLLIT